MICQKCNQREATVLLNIQINQQRKQYPLCHSCYAEEKNQLKIPAGHHNNYSIEDLFKDFNQYNKNKGSEHITTEKNKGILDQLGRNLTNMAKAGMIDPVIGRDEEVDRVIEILNRRNKNNPVLIGEPGVGKTAIVEGLALKIAESKVPSKLLNKEVYLLDVAGLVANTGIRGQFEERMKQIITELQERKNIILFIDEIHLLVGAGSAEGSMDAGNILKPALARGELQLVGATTLKEYRKIEKDAALERRFQPITVNEPTIDEAIQILTGIKEKYEDYHEVSYSEEAIKACVTLSSRYIQDRFLPDKAIDLLDEAGSKKNLMTTKINPNDLQKQLLRISKEKDQAAQEENYELAAQLRVKEIEIEAKLKEQSQQDKAVVQVEDIQKIIEKKTGIPVGKLQENDQEKLKNLASNLSKKVIGQDEAVQKISKAIRRSRAGLKTKHRPVGSFLFVGPTGVGKTELTKTLAQELFGSKDAMVRLDMSEYMEKHSVSKIIGSPPGYVGHEEAGQLTEKVRRNPYSIILLDEIEKAHPDVLHLFLQLLEDGRLTDSQGRTVSFKDSVIIMTSNAGVGEKKISVGFENTNPTSSSILDSLRNYFKPEFLNRLDGIIEFNQLSKIDMHEIVSIMIGELNETLLEQNLTLRISDDAKALLADLGYSPQFGARPLRRTIQENIEDPITDLLLDESGVKSIIVKEVEGMLVIESE
ncbi:ATP-dependent Clp protease ATP-binding subunit ClpE [Bacillus mesophilus]|uniref:AAA domain-containing protein n=1 Tax=Bacillus mesophilus TaxID=1808955 RepID=A0A6M0Q2S7_9BACI|nr:ATP-dependent Clp protease ATP-binding subunit [Bacillus mesophilus]MBM7659634.1 ATP-dependent Clp protease ATP-binding subunit ClpE [Bacillus mesophilus]NEY70502.1 AAA domain-containing protein [Bacillus mesophilus]